jgi:hypothetical protein
MAFITHCWRKSQRLEQLFQSYLMGGGRLCVTLMCLWCISLATSVHADTPVELQALKFERSDNELYLSGAWRFDLPPSIQDALFKGITLYFVTEADIHQERWYVYNQRVAHAERHVRLFYQPLTRRWRVSVSPQPFNVSGLGVSIGQSHDSAEEALVAVQRLVRWRIANASDINWDIKSTISINFRLDLKQLPRPMQIGAVGQSDWNISFSKTQRLELTP